MTDRRSPKYGWDEQTKFWSINVAKKCDASVFNNCRALTGACPNSLANAEIRRIAINPASLTRMQFRAMQMNAV
jgi:hypothetical protein